MRRVLVVEKVINFWAIVLGYCIRICVCYTPIEVDSGLCLELPQQAEGLAHRTGVETIGELEI
jgi:hypothetical protein